MKFDCGETYREKETRKFNEFINNPKNQAKMKWHDWFAWRPIRIDGHDCRWLEVIQRCLILPFARNEYKDFSYYI